MFRAVYFLRIWRHFIKDSRCYNLSKNFISQNAYLCIETNAKGLIELIKRFRNENTPHLFLPPIFDSQTCEKTFRLLRSMGSVNFTRINFTLYDLLHMFRRTEVQNEIAYFKLAEDEVHFPLSHKRSIKTDIHDFSTDAKIIETLIKAKEVAVEEALAFGMHSENIDEFEFKSNLQSKLDDDSDEDSDFECDEMFDENVGNEEMSGDTESTLQDPTFNLDYIDPGSPLVSVVDEHGKEKIIRKSHLIWMLSEPGTGLSKDRLTRVRVAKKQKRNHDA